MITIPRTSAGTRSWRTSVGSPPTPPPAVSVPRREGRALCQGIVRCGCCGRSMAMTYQRNGTPRYTCASARADHVVTPDFRSITATGVDELVASRLLAALAPEEIALALAAAEEVTERRARSNRALELRVEPASMKRRAPSARSTPATPRTASSRAASRHAGRPSSASSQETKRSSPSTPIPPRSPRARRSRRSRPTCPHCRPRRRLQRRTANGCYARSSATSPSRPSPTATSYSSACAGAQAQPSSTPSPARYPPARRTSHHPRRSN